jgi:hypothetical protein
MLATYGGPIIFGVTHLRESNTYELMGIHTYLDLAELCLGGGEYRGKYISSSFKLAAKTTDPVYFFKLVDLEKALVLDNYAVTSELSRDVYEIYKAAEDKLGIFKLNQENESITAQLPKTFAADIRYKFALKYHQADVFANTYFLSGGEPDWMQIQPAAISIIDMLTYIFERSPY